MTFDATQPTASTKIRNLSTVIPDNWSAIESAGSSFKPEGLNLNNRTPLAVANDPTAIAEAVIAYSKDDSAGDPQMYAIDPSSAISQLTGSIFTETTNGGTAGGTLYKVEFTMFPGNRIVYYGGLTAAFSGSATVILPEAYTTIYSVWCTAADPTVQKVSYTGSNTPLTFRTENSVTVSWGIIGKI